VKRRKGLVGMLRRDERPQRNLEEMRKGPAGILMNCLKFNGLEILSKKVLRPLCGLKSTSFYWKGHYLHYGKSAI
jgi:hypothetical protein